MKPEQIIQRGLEQAKKFNAPSDVKKNLQSNLKQETVFLEPTIIAIDPGVKGGFAIFSPDNIAAFPFVNVREIRKLLIHYQIDQAIIEKVHASPQMGKSSVFTFGQNFGEWLGLLAGLSIPVGMVLPQVWQFGIEGLKGIQGAERKRLLKEEAQRRFPDKKVTLAIADALLIGDWWIRNNSDESK